MRQIQTHDVLSILNGRSKDFPDLDPYSYSYKIAGTNFGLDVPVVGDLDIDEREMALTIPAAAGGDRDGVGDLLSVEGINTSRHIKNPIILYDHGKEITRPIARARKDPKDIDTYGFHIDAIGKKASCRVWFYQGVGNCALDGSCPPGTHSQFTYELFDMAAKGFIGGGSVGYQVIQGTPLQPDYVTGLPQGLHLLKILLLEVSLVVLPANAATVGKTKSLLSDKLLSTLDYIQKALTGGLINGQPPSELFVKSFAHRVPARPLIANGWSAQEYRSKELKVPNYRKAEDSEYSCQTCEAFQPQGGQFGSCRMFGVGVTPESVCDRWTSAETGEQLGEKSLSMHGPKCKCAKCMAQYGKKDQKSCSCESCQKGHACPCESKGLEIETKAEGGTPPKGSQPQKPRPQQPTVKPVAKTPAQSTPPTVETTTSHAPPQATQQATPARKPKLTTGETRKLAKLERPKDESMNIAWHEARERQKERRARGEMETSEATPEPEQEAPEPKMGRRGALGAIAGGTAAALGGGLLEGARRAGRSQPLQQKPTPIQESTPRTLSGRSTREIPQRGQPEEVGATSPEGPDEELRRLQEAGSRLRGNVPTEEEAQLRRMRQNRERGQQQGESDSLRRLREAREKTDRGDAEARDAERQRAMKLKLTPQEMQIFDRWKATIEQNNPSYFRALEAEPLQEQGRRFRKWRSMYGKSLPDQDDKSVPEYAWNTKSLRDLRLKYRVPQGRFHRSKRGTPGTIHMDLALKDLEKLRKDAGVKGVEVHWIKDDGKGSCRVKLVGMDPVLEELAKNYAKAINRGATHMKNLPRENKNVGTNLIGTLPRQDKRGEEDSKGKKQGGALSRERQTLHSLPSQTREGSADFQGDMPPAVSVRTSNDGPDGSKSKGLSGKKKAADALVSKPYLPDDGKGKGPKGELDPQQGYSPNVDRGGIMPGQYETKQAPEEENPLDTAPEGRGEGGIEPYGAQVVRRFYADAAGLLHEYDEIMEQLEDGKVQQLASEVLQWLSAQLDKLEDLWGGHEKYRKLPPLEGSEPEEKEEEEEDLEGGQSESAATSSKPATGRLDKEPTPDEALEGMQLQETGKDLTIPQMKALYFARIKALRSHYKDGSSSMGGDMGGGSMDGDMGGGMSGAAPIESPSTSPSTASTMPGMPSKNFKDVKSLERELLSLRKHLIILGNRNDQSSKNMRIHIIKKLKKTEEMKDTLLHGKEDKKHRPGSDEEKFGGMDVETGKGKASYGKKD